MSGFFKGKLIEHIISLTGLAIVCNEFVSAFMTRIYRSGKLLFGSNIYYFFDAYPVPFPAHSLHLNDKHSAKPVISYDVDNYLFYPYLCDLMGKKYNKLPILSLEILDSGGEVAYDLTNYIEKIRFVSNDDGIIPTISEIVICWVMTSGIVIDFKKYTIRFINDDGDINTGRLDFVEKLHSE
jgi:hypothetical protein